MSQKSPKKTFQVSYYVSQLHSLLLFITKSTEQLTIRCKVKIWKIGEFFAYQYSGLIKIDGVTLWLENGINLNFQMYIFRTQPLVINCIVWEFIELKKPNKFILSAAGELTANIYGFYVQAWHTHQAGFTKARLLC